MGDDTLTSGHNEFDQPASRQIGPYKLLHQIGEGGMGTVWLAHQDEPVRRRVALKLIKAAAADERVIARFEAERQALAMMDHPHIAKILDAGTAADGSPYFVMELVSGIAITDYCDRNKLSPRERLQLFIPVCSAIQHAHQKGIIHRDIKPSNVLVAMQDGQPMAKVIDFGLAKALQHQTRLNDQTMFTEFGQVLGTVRYMSPEQAMLDALDIDTRTDVYSLGVLLYELMTGSTPIEEDTIRGNALLRVLELIREKDPPRPSHRLSSSMEKLDSVSDLRRIQPTKLQQILRGDLDWIIMRALEKDRTRRYESASTFADDVRRYLGGEAVLARPPSAAYQLRKFVGKHRALVAGVGTIAALLVSGITGTTWFALDAQVARSEAEESATQSQAALQMVTDAFKSLDPRYGGDAQMPARTVLVNLRNALPSSPLNDEGRVIVLETLTESFGNVGDYEAAMSTVLEELEISRGVHGAHAIPTLKAESNLAFLTSRTGDFNEARRLQEQTVKAASEHLGDRHAVTLGLKHVLANLLHAVDERERAIAVLERVIADGNQGDEEAQGAAKEAVIDLGRFYTMAGRFDEATQLLESAMREFEAGLGEDHPVTLNTMTSLGVAYHQSFQFDAAIALRERTLALQQKKMGAEHPFTLDTMNNLANSYNALGRSAEAMALHEKVYEIRMRTMGEEHPHTLMTMQNLARAYQGADRYEEAIALLKRSLVLRERVLGASHNHTLGSMTNLGTAYYQQGRYEEAAELFRRRVEINLAKHGDRHRQTLRANVDLAVIYRTLGQSEESIELLNSVLDVQTEDVGREHPDAIGTRNALADSYLAAGHLAEGIKHHQETLELRTAAFGPEHVTVYKSKHALSNAYHSAGQVQRAIDLLEEVISFYKERSGAQHSDTLLISNDLGAAYLSAGRVEEALAIHEATAVALESAVGGNNQHTIRAKRYLAYAYEIAGRLPEAIPLYVEVHDRWESLRGQTHPDTLQALVSLARARLATGALDPAQSLADECRERVKNADQAEWVKHYAQSLLGGVALQRGELEEAKSHLMTAYEALRQLPKLSPNRKARFAEVLGRLVELAEERHDQEDEQRWRAELKEFVGEAE